MDDDWVKMERIASRLLAIIQQIEWHGMYRGQHECQICAGKFPNHSATCELWLAKVAAESECITK